MKPKYLFADEPNSGLDPQTAILVDNLLKKITYELQTTTIVTVSYTHLTLPTKA